MRCGSANALPLFVARAGAETPVFWIASIVTPSAYHSPTDPWPAHYSPLTYSPLTSLVFPIRILRVLEVPQRSPTTHRGSLLEVVGRGRRSRGPFQGPGIPGIVAGRLAVSQRRKQVVNEDRITGDLDDRSERSQLVPDGPVRVGAVGVDPPRHAQHSRDVHRPKSQDETDVQEPELPAGQ